MPLHDKDFESQTQARLVFVPEVVRAQIKAYRIWIRRVIERIGCFVGPELIIPSKRSTLSTDGENGAVQRKLRDSLFFLSMDEKPQAASPRAVRELFGDRYPLAANAQRHLLRTKLTEWECDEGAINAFLGHWDMGEEPWSRFSTFDPQAYRAEISRFIEPFLMALGFEAIDARPWRR